MGDAGTPARLDVLIVSADIGESHSAMARALRHDIETSAAAVRVTVIDDFRILGPFLTRLLYRRARRHIVRLHWSYHIAYQMFMHLRPLRALAEWLIYLCSRHSLARLVESRDPSVIVSTHPFMSVGLARMRRSGRLSVPVCAVVGPIGGLGYWVQPGADCHLVHYEQAVPAVRRMAGASAAHAVRPMVDPRFLTAGDAARARRRHGLHTGGPVILICGGGWGVGDLAGSVETALQSPSAQVVAIAGRNDTLREALHARYQHNSRVSVLGFTAAMSDLLAAADVFITSSVGVSCFEARLRGCPVVCYGYPLAHVRDNMQGLGRHGLARAAYSTSELRQAITDAVAAGRRPEPELTTLPNAARYVLAAAGRRPVNDRQRTPRAVVEDCAARVAEGAPR